MNREQIRQHWADVVMAVFKAESEVEPDLQERRSALGENPTHEQAEQMGRLYCLDVADELLKGWTDEELRNEYGE